MQIGGPFQISLQSFLLICAELVQLALDLLAKPARSV
jgi:hypothetical protein